MMQGGGGPGAGSSPRKRGKLRQAPRGTKERQRNIAAGIKSPLKRNKQPSQIEEDDSESAPAPALRAMLERQNTLRGMLAQNPDAGPTPMLDLCDEESLSDASIAFHHRKSVAEMQSVSLLDLEGLIDDSDDDESLDAFELGNDPACGTQKKPPNNHNPALLIIRACEKRKKQNGMDSQCGASFNFLQAVDGNLDVFNASTAASSRLDLGENQADKKKEVSDELGFEMEHAKPIRRTSSSFSADTLNTQKNRSRSRDHSKSRSEDPSLAHVKQVIRERSRTQQAKLRNKEEQSQQGQIDQSTTSTSSKSENQTVQLSKTQHSDPSSTDDQTESTENSNVEQKNPESAKRLSHLRRQDGRPHSNDENGSSPSPERRQRRKSSDKVEPLGKGDSTHSSSKPRHRSNEDKQQLEGCVSPRRSRRRSSDSLVKPGSKDEISLSRHSSHSEESHSEEKISPRRSRSSDHEPSTERRSSPRRRSREVNQSSESNSPPRRSNSSDVAPSSESNSPPRRSKSSDVAPSSESKSPPRRSKSSDAAPSSSERTSSHRRSSKSSETSSPSKRGSSPKQSHRRSSESKHSSSGRLHRKSGTSHSKRSPSRTHSRSKEKSGHRKRSQSQAPAIGGRDPEPVTSTSSKAFLPMLRRARSLTDVFAFGKAVESASTEQGKPADAAKEKFQRLMVRFTSMRNLMSHDRNDN